GVCLRHSIPDTVARPAVGQTFPLPYTTGRAFFLPLTQGTDRGRRTAVPVCTGRRCDARIGDVDSARASAPPACGPPGPSVLPDGADSMHRFVPPSLALCALAFGSGWAGAQDCRALVERAIQAHGGAERLARWQAVSSRSRGTLHAGGGASFTAESFTQLP